MQVGYKCHRAFELGFDAIGFLGAAFLPTVSKGFHLAPRKIVTVILWRNMAASGPLSGLIESRR